MRNISIIRNYNELNKNYEKLLKRVDKVLTIIEQEGGNRGWEYEKKMPEVMTEEQIKRIYDILKEG